MEISISPRKKKVLAFLFAWFVVWQLILTVTSTYSDNDESIAYIKRPDIGRFGDTTYYSYKPWDSYHEKVTIYRFFSPSIVIQVDKNKRVSSIHYMPNLFPSFQKDRVLYLRDDGTVSVSYRRYDDDGHSYEEFKDEFKWAEDRVRETRQRFAHLIPEKFKIALGIDH